MGAESVQSHGVSTEPRSSALGGAPDIVDAQLLLAAEHTSLSGSWWLNLENGETVWSPEMYEIFGLDPASGPAREGVERLRHPDDAASVTAVIEATMTSGGSFSIAYRVIRPSGEVRLLDARGWVESRANGHGRYARGTVHDITNAALLAPRRPPPPGRGGRHPRSPQARPATASAAPTRSAGSPSSTPPFNSSFAVRRPTSAMSSCTISSIVT